MAFPKVVEDQPFFIPENNKNEIEQYKDKNGNYSIFKGNIRLEVIPVNTPEDVLAALFGEKWFESLAFREVYDLKYMLQQEILASNFVKIKNMSNCL